MGQKYIKETLISTSKMINEIINKQEDEATFQKNRQTWINEINAVIRQLDHLVEKLEKDS